MAKLNSTEQQILKNIDKWKAESPSFLSRATSFIAKPINWASDKFVPESVKSKMNDLSEKVLEKLQNVSSWMVNRNEVLKATKEFEIDSETILQLKKASIHDLDHVAEDFIKKNKLQAAAEGFGSGLLGWPGLIADIPMLFIFCFKMINQISLSYGYDPEEDEEIETVFMLYILKIATAANRTDKMKAILNLKDFEESVSKNLGADYTVKQFSKNAAIQVSKTIIKEIIINTFNRKAIALVPGIGAIFSGGFNYAYVGDVGEAAFMLYRERFLLDKKGREKIINIEID